jgi:hypothetical protein
MKNEEITGFENNPVLKKLIINYCLMQYEENAIIDDDHLIMEFRLLQKENRLHELFVSEKLNNLYK